MTTCYLLFAEITDADSVFIGGIMGIAAPIGGKTPAIVDEVIAAIARAAFAARLRIEEHNINA